MMELLGSIFPGAILIFGALLVPFLKGNLRNAYVVLLPILSALQLFAFELGFQGGQSFFGLELTIVRFDALSRIFGIVFHIAAVLVCIYGWHVKRSLDHICTLIYAGSAIGATFAGDLVTLFVFWELTAVSSVFLVWARGMDEPARKERAYRAGMRYLIVQVGSGVALLAGVLLHFRDTGSIAFENFGLDASRGAPLIFLAFGVKAAFPLLHNWVQDAYPESTVAGTVVLASFTTKLAIYALARGFAGTEILIPIGATMTVFPIFFAVIENDLRRVLAYSLNNQLGYMIVGIGIGTELALNGAAAHAFAHILYKGLLLMSMGAVLFRTGTINASELGGLHKSMPLTTVFCIIGAMAISAVPGLSGFVTKSMVISAVGNEHLTIIFGVLLFASAGVADHSGIKIPFFTFFAHDQGHRVKEAPLHMLIPMGIAAALCIGIGVYPDALYSLLPFPATAAEYHPYDATHVLTMLELLLFAGLAFVVLMKLGVYPPELPRTNLDTDWFYRRFAKNVALDFGHLAEYGRASLWQGFVRFRNAMLRVIGHHHQPPEGMLGEPWTASATTLWAALLLGALLLMYYS